MPNQYWSLNCWRSQLLGLNRLLGLVWHPALRSHLVRAQPLGRAVTDRTFEVALIKNREKYFRLEDDEHMYYLFAYDLLSTFDVNMLLFAFYVPFVVVVYMARIINFSAKYKHRKSLCFTAPSAQEIFAHAPRRRCRRIVCDKSGERLVQNLRSSPQIGCCRRYINVHMYVYI